MAAIFAKQGCPAAREADGQEIGSPRAGNSVVLSLVTASTSVNHALPLDNNGAQYQAVVLSAGVGSLWVIFGTSGADAAAVGTSPAFLLNPNSPMTIGVPIGATNIAAISTTGNSFLSVLGIF